VYLPVPAPGAARARRWPQARPHSASRAGSIGDLQSRPGTSLVAKLHGYRLAVAQETQGGRCWDEAKIKSMTGGDKMTARFMRQDFFDFKPKFKLFITGNHKPHLENVDEAIRRRMLLVPFTVQIPVEERDPQLADKLMAEGPAILRWCTDGCAEWQHHGLMPPAVVTEATDAYFDDQDTIGQWLDDCTDDGGSLAVTPAKQPSDGSFATTPTRARARARGRGQAPGRRGAVPVTNPLFSSWKNWTEERASALPSGGSVTTPRSAHLPPSLRGRIKQRHLLSL